MMVKAKQTGYDGLKLRREGEVFELPKHVPFSHKWMINLEEPEAKSEAKVKKGKAKAEPKDEPSDEVI